MTRHMEISLNPRQSGSTPLFEYKTKSIGQRLWKKLFGKQRMVILFPAESIGVVTIIEQATPGGHEVKGVVS